MHRVVSFALLIGCVFAAPPVPKGFEFLGFGYDYLLGNPLETRGFGDMGYKSNVFEFETTEGKMTEDGLWSVPDKTTVSVDHTCAQTLENNTIKNSADYRKAQNKSFNLNFSFSDPNYTDGDKALGKLGFVFSSGSVDVHNHTESNADIFYLKSFSCAVYTLNMNIFDTPKVSDNFCFGVEFLPTTYDESAYMLWIGEFGTHVITRLKAGGRWGRQVMISAHDVNTLDETGHDVDVGVSVEAYISAGFEVKDSRFMSEAITISKYISKNSTFNIGGNFTTDPDEWHDSVSASPMPVDVSEPVPIHNFVNKRYCPDSSMSDDDFSKKRAVLADAINYKYCAYLKSKAEFGSYDYVKCPEKEADLIVI